MAKNLKKLLSLVLAMVMVLSLIPAVSATETDEEVTETPAATEPAATEPAATEPDDGIEWIENGDETTWNEWFSNKNNSKLMKT